jgi:hypothetical protein
VMDAGFIHGLSPEGANGQPRAALI